MVLKMQYTGNSINVVFSTNSLYKQVTVSKYLFTPHSGLIIGEISALGYTDINGTKQELYSYPIPNDTFSVNFGMQGGIANLAQVYTFEYVTNYNIISSIAGATCYYNNQTSYYYSTFQWLNNYNSYSGQAIANYTSSISYINASITLHYKETPAAVYPLN
jgi:hypothetical protein